MTNHVPRSTVDIGPLVNPRERIYFALVVVISVLVYAGLIGLVWSSNAPLVSTLVVYGVMFAVFIAVSHGLLLGHVRGSGVRISERQFPVLHRAVQDQARALGMKSAPEAYVLQSGGVLNAFATRSLRRNFVVLYSDVVALSERGDTDALNFIVGHELGHHVRGHLKWRWLTAPGRVIPFLGAAYSRACEYTCDRVGERCAPEGALSGLLVLAAGKELHGSVDIREFSEQADTHGGFWVVLAELFASHPHLSKRVQALLRAGVPVQRSPQRPMYAAAPLNDMSLVP
jgi:Zn-dependent protease with chaperone function